MGNGDVALFRRLRGPMSGLTHGIEALLAMIGLVILIDTAVHPLRPWHLVTHTVFGLGMIALYTVSTLYH